jgi:nucleoside-diphosphate-sugar epimerase
LIAGCGYVGCALASRLVADGAEVFGLRRRPQGLPAGVEPIAADLGDPASLGPLPGRLDAVVYAASADGADEARYHAAYVAGVRNLLGELAQVGRLLFVSSTSVYGQRHGEWVDESSPTEPEGFRGRLVLAGEACARSGPFPAVAVRFGGIYGPGRTRLVERVRAGEARYRPDHFTNRIHRDDCAGVLRHLVALERPEPVVLAVDDEPAEERVVLEWLAERLGAPPPRSGGEAVSGGSKRCRNARLRASGYRFRFPTFREGYAALLGG